MKLKELLEMVIAADANPVMPTNRFPLTTKSLKKKLKKKKDNLIRFNTLMNEDLNIAKFKYKRWKHDKNPEVAILDYHYKGKKGEKKISDDVLGWNVNYYANKKEAIDTINDIDSFARMLSANDLEKYRRVRYFFPKQGELLRRYKKEAINKIKEKDGWLWKKTSLDALEKKHKSNY